MIHLRDVDGMIFNGVAAVLSYAVLPLPVAVMAEPRRHRWPTCKGISWIVVTGEVPDVTKILFEHLAAC